MVLYYIMWKISEATVIYILINAIHVTAFAWLSSTMLMIDLKGYTCSQQYRCINSAKREHINIKTEICIDIQNKMKKCIEIKDRI